MPKLRGSLTPRPLSKPRSRSAGPGLREAWPDEVRSLLSGRKEQFETLDQPPTKEPHHQQGDHGVDFEDHPIQLRVVRQSHERFPHAGRDAVNETGEKIIPCCPPCSQQ